MTEPRYRLEFCLPSDKRVHRVVSEVQRSLQHTLGMMLMAVAVTLLIQAVVFQVPMPEKLLSIRYVTVACWPGLFIWDYYYRQVYAFPREGDIEKFQADLKKWALLCLLFVPSLLVYVITENTQFVSWYALIVGLIALAGSLLYGPVLGCTYRVINGGRKLPLTYVFGEGTHFKAGDAEFPYAKLHYIAETEAYFLLFESEQDVHVIPKTELPMGEDDFRHFLRMQSGQSIEPHFVANSFRRRCVTGGVIAAVAVVLTVGLFLFQYAG